MQLISVIYEILLEVNLKELWNIMDDYMSLTRFPWIYCMFNCKFEMSGL